MMRSSLVLVLIFDIMVIPLVLILRRLRLFTLSIRLMIILR